MANSLPLPPSLWVATARPAPATPPLDMSRQADVAIVGAGYSGLAAALQLAEAGASVIVLEAGEPGWGASGRNGGQVIPGLKSDPDELIAMFGPEAGEHLYASLAARRTRCSLLSHATGSTAERGNVAGSSRLSRPLMSALSRAEPSNGSGAARPLRSSTATGCAGLSGARSTMAA